MMMMIMMMVYYNTLTWPIGKREEVSKRLLAPLAAEDADSIGAGDRNMDPGKNDPGFMRRREITFTTAYSMRDAKTKVRQTIIQTSIALMYETRGSDSRALPLIVVVVRTVRRPRETRAGEASMLIQKDTQERITMRMLGT